MRRSFGSVTVGLLLLIVSAARAGEITVSAAASLSDAFTEIARRYEATHPETRVWLNTGASGALYQQMKNGAPVDVFASADEDTMTSAVEARLVNPDARREFARNTLVVIMPSDEETTLSAPVDLSQAHVHRLALGNPATVPAGRYGMAALKHAGAWESVKDRLFLAENVRQVLAYVARGEVDAGIVYATDAKIMAVKVRVAFALPSSLPVRYVMAPTANAKNPKDAALFTAFVLSQESQNILRKYGFQRAE